MPMSLRFLVLVAVVTGALVSGTTTAQPSVSPMQLTIDISARAHDGVVLPSNFAVRAGGTVTLTFRNHTHLFHTFTVRELGISVLIRPAVGASPRLTTITFVPRYGVYSWECVLCSAGAHPAMHVMHGKMYAIVNT
jgi:plastocyanin